MNNHDPHNRQSMQDALHELEDRFPDCRIAFLVIRANPSCGEAAGYISNSDHNIMCHLFKHLVVLLESHIANTQGDA